MPSPSASGWCVGTRRATHGSRCTPASRGASCSTSPPIRTIPSASLPRPGGGGSPRRRRAGCRHHAGAGWDGEDAARSHADDGRRSRAGHEGRHAARSDGRRDGPRHDGRHHHAHGADDARVATFLSHLLERHGNPRLDLGGISEAEEGSITAEIVTIDGALVQRLSFNRYPGLFRQID